MFAEELAAVRPPEVPGYRVIHAIGAGSRGVVFRARRLDDQEIVALKVLKGEAVSDLAETGEDAERELGVRLRALSRASVVELVVPTKVVSFGRPMLQDFGLALEMEFVDGDSLAQVLRRGVRLSPARAGETARRLASALEESHAAGLAHGMLHPGKVLLLPGGSRGQEVRLLGMGLGEPLPREFETPYETGRLSPHIYAAPEVLSGDRAIPPSDVFSLGAVLYHLLTGRPPYRADSLPALLVERADGPPSWPRGAPSEVPPALMGLVDRMLRAAPGERPDPARLRGEIATCLKKKTKAVPMVRFEPPADMAPRAGGKSVRQVRSGRRRLVEAVRSSSFVTAALGAGAAAALAAIALLLRPGPGEPAPKGEVGPTAAQTEGVEVARAPSPAPAPAAEEVEKAEDGPARAASDPQVPLLEEVRDIERLFEADPEAAAALGGRIREISRLGGEAGLRAALLLGRIRSVRESRADEGLRALLDRAAALEADGRYGEAAEVLAGFPKDEYRGTRAASRAGLENEALRGRAAAWFAGLESRAGEFLARGDFEAARRTYESVRRRIGLPEWVRKAEDALSEIGLLEEKRAEAAATRRAAELARRLKRRADGAMVRSAEACRSFKYGTAEGPLLEILAEKALLSEDRERVSSYLQAVRMEIRHFRTVQGRIARGKKQGMINFPGSPRRFPIKSITEKGIEFAGGAGGFQAELSWSLLGPYQILMLMREVGAELTRIEERMALAVFAHHRGLSTERENELRVAMGLADRRRSEPEREAVGRLRRTLEGAPVP